MSRRPIVVGIDGSVGSYAALLWALDEGHAQSRSVVLLHSVEPARTGDGLPAAESDDAALVAVGERVLAEAATVARTGHPSVVVGTRLSRKNASDALVEASAEAELVVVAIRGHGQDVSGILGSLSQRLAVHSHCPVAVVPASPSVPPSGDRALPRVVVGIASTSAGRLALEFAFKEAGYRSAELVCIRAWGHPGAGATPSGKPAAPSGGPDPDELLLGHFAALRARYPQVQVEQILVPGEPVEALLEAARDAQLLVVGCFHSDETWTSRLGPVPAALLRRAGCPILVVGKGQSTDASGSASDTEPQIDQVIDRVVVGLDGSAAAAAALAWAVGEADRKGVVLVIAHATDTFARKALSAATVVSVLRDSTANGQRLASEAAAEVARAHPRLQLSTVLRAEKPADLLLSLGGPSTLTVVGTNGDGRIAGALLGSVSHRVAAHADGPVAVISDEEASGSAPGRVVVGVSDSPGAVQALRFACREAIERHATLIAVRAYGVFGRSTNAQIFGPLHGLRQSEERLLQNAVKQIHDEFPQVAVEPHLIDEPVHDALHEESLKAELLVLGCHYPDKHWPSRLGATVSMMLHRSPCPVIVVGLADAAGTQPC